MNPCDDSFTGTGTSEQGLGFPVQEHVTGHLTATHFDFYSTYDDTMPQYGDYWWTYDGPRTGGYGDDFFGAHFSVNSMVFNLTDATDYKNHGQYVKQMGSDEAHSCIGMPIVSAPFEWSTSGTVNSDSSAGTDVLLPRTGTYRIDVNGTWQNGPWYLVDAEYTEQSPGVWADGWPGYPTVDFGDLQVNNQFVNWGAYNAAHAYSYAVTAASTTLNLKVWDMWGDLTTDGHGDNVGSLDFIVTYTGP
jgi:hypothetical protein